jgi:nucleotide-binding universal stress UspA family protein
MAIRHLLVHVDTSRRATERIDLAAALARRFGARLTGLFAELGSLGPSLLGRRSREDLDRAAEGARAAFDARAGAAGIETQWWSVEPGDYAQVVGAAVVCCRYADLAVLGQHDPEDARVPEDLVEQVLLGSGRPLLVVPWAGRFPDAGRRVVVAWNGTAEAARAVNDAIPFMRGAEAVTVLGFQKPPAGEASALPSLDIAAHLGAHGIAVRYERTVVEVGEVDFADALLNRAFDEGADLAVMGGHAVPGVGGLHASSNVRKVLGSMTLPVLVSR